MKLSNLENIQEWAPIKIDCSALPISLNLEGTKKNEQPNLSKNVQKISGDL
jgi:hypothetical protein